jgi:hypothetical protein
MLLGLLSPIEQRNGWWLAEHAGHVSPDRMQRLLRTAAWDDERVRADLREFIVDRLGHADGVLVADETATSRKGGIRRQCSASTAGPPGGWKQPDRRVVYLAAGPGRRSSSTSTGMPSGINGRCSTPATASPTK